MGSAPAAQVPVGPAALNPSVPGVSQGPFPTMPGGSTGSLGYAAGPNNAGGMFSNLPGATYKPTMSTVSGPSPLALNPPAPQTPSPNWRPNEMSAVQQFLGNNPGMKSTADQLGLDLNGVPNNGLTGAPQTQGAWYNQLVASLGGH